MRLVYDSNVLGSRDLPLDNVSRGSDVRASPEVGVAVTWPLGPQLAYLNGALGYDFYRRNSNLNRERIDLDGGLALNRIGSRCTGGLGIGYGRRQSDVGDLIIIQDPDGRINAVNVQQEVNLSANISCGAMFGLSPGLGYSRSTTTNSDGRRAQNISSDTYSANIAYRGPGLGTVTLTGSYTDGRYPNRLLIGGGDDGIEVYSGNIGYDREIGTRFGGNISVGFSKVKPKDPLVADFNGITYSAMIRALLTERLSTNLSVSRGAQQSNLLALSYSINTTYNFSGTYRITDRVSAPFSLSYSKRRFETGPNIPGAVLFGRSDNFYSVSGGLTFRPRPRLNLGVNASYNKRTSGTSLLDYSARQLSVFVGLDL